MFYPDSHLSRDEAITWFHLSLGETHPLTHPFHSGWLSPSNILSSLTWADLTRWQQHCQRILCHTKVVFFKLTRFEGLRTKGVQSGHGHGSVIKGVGPYGIYLGKEMFLKLISYTDSISSLSLWTFPRNFLLHWIILPNETTAKHNFDAQVQCQTDQGAYWLSMTPLRWAWRTKYSHLSDLRSSIHFSTMELQEINFTCFNPNSASQGHTSVLWRQRMEAYWYNTEP